MSDATRLRAEWGRIWTASGAKTHIMPSCPYVTDRHSPAAVDAYPESHVDLCDWCARRFGSWRDGLERDGAHRCDRCGERTSNVRYCADCQLHVERMRARR